ncbi:permuted papain-like amidase YaeF/Yiix C92 family enzyme [Methylorubrum extorquens]
MKKRLDIKSVNKGDIILTTSDAFISGKIRIATQSPVSHAMMCVAASSIIHAVGEGVQAENPQGIFFDEHAPVFVMRLKEGLPGPVALRICDYAREHTGTQYSRLEAVKAAFVGSSKVSSRQFCSRLIAQSYRKAGYDLVENADYCTPGDLLNSNRLQKIENAIETLTDEQYKHWIEAVASPVDHSAAALKTVLEAVRKFDPSVQSFQDIGRFVINNPEQDSFVKECLVSSGFIESWTHDVDQHPWRFSKDQIAQMSGLSIRNYCELTVKDGRIEDHRYYKSLQGLRYDFDRAPRETLRILIELYENLLEMHTRRIEAANFWLSNNVE